MQPIRIIYDDTPAAIPIPEGFRHGRSEIIIWPLPAESPQGHDGKSVGPEQGAQRKRRVPPPALAGKVRELGDVNGVRSPAESEQDDTEAFLAVVAGGSSSDFPDDITDVDLGEDSPCQDLDQ